MLTASPFANKGDVDSNPFLMETTSVLDNPNRSQEWSENRLSRGSLLSGGLWRLDNWRL